MDIIKIGKAIAYLRKRAGYTQKELAYRLGISDKAVSKWERGQGLPEIGYFQKLSILLDTDSDSLLAGDVAHHRNGWAGMILLTENPYEIGAGTMIYDKALICFLISYFLLVGIRDIYVAGTKNDAEYIRQYLGDGKEYGIQITTVIGGIKELSSIYYEKNTERNGNIMLVYGRCILYGVDQTRFFQKAMLDREHLTVLALPKKLQEATIAVDIDKRVLQDKDDNPMKIRTQYDFSEIPISFFPESLLKEIVEENSIYSYLEQQKRDGKLYAETLDRGFVEIMIEDWNNVQEASTFLKIVQSKCGMNVYCLEEVAWRRGMISLEQLKSLGEKKKKTEYGEYVLELYERLSSRVLGDSENN